MKQPQQFQLTKSQAELLTTGHIINTPWAIFVWQWGGWWRLKQTSPSEFLMDNDLTDFPDNVGERMVRLTDVLELLQPYMKTKYYNIMKQELEDLAHKTPQ